MLLSVCSPPDAFDKNPIALNQYAAMRKLLAGVPVLYRAPSWGPGDPSAPNPDAIVGELNRAARWAEVLVREDNQLLVELTWRPKQQAWTALDPTSPLWATYAWNNGWLRRPPLAVVDYFVRAQIAWIKSLAQAIEAQGGDPYKIIILGCTGEPRRVMYANGVAYEDRSSALKWELDDDFWRAEGLMLQLIAKLLPDYRVMSATMAGNPTEIGLRIDHYAARLAALKLDGVVTDLGYNTYLNYLAGGAERDYPSIGAYVHDYHRRHDACIAGLRESTIGDRPIWSVESAAMPFAKGSPKYTDQARAVAEREAYRATPTRERVMSHGLYQMCETAPNTPPATTDTYGIVKIDGTTALSPLLSS